MSRRSGFVHDHKQAVTGGAERAGREIKDKDVRAMVNAAVDVGWTYVPPKTTTRHGALLSPDGQIRIGVACNQSSRRNHMNLRSRLRAGGVQIP